MPDLVKRSAGLVSTRELHATVSEAVRLASTRLKIAEPSGPLHIRWDLIGRILRDLKQAQPFAQDVTKQLAAKGIKAVPAVLIIDKRIIAGFYEKIAVPQLREFG